MAGYQFLHIEGYSRAGSVQTIEKKARPKSGDTPVRKKTKTFDKWSIHEIADEALRVEGACDHVKVPMPPTVLLGAGVREAVAHAEGWAAGMTDAQGRKLRKDGLCLLAGVISLPRSRIEEWPAFQQGALEWLKAKYGERLRCVVEHLDEAHPHLHFYCVPLAGPVPRPARMGRCPRADQSVPDRSHCQRTTGGWPSWRSTGAEREQVHGRFAAG